MTPKYRSDIDGLRAIAVGGVVLFHAFPAYLTGGYIGVDIFFVISGFLITTIIVNEAKAGTFSILKFYERRFRRILPALFAMLLATTAAAMLLLPPEELRDYGKSLIAVTLFASNIQFWLEGGYFDGPAEDKPLLHTWSLAVEEQFYIFWPLIVALLIAFGRQRSLRTFVWIAVLASLVASEYVVRHWPNQAFYLIPYKAWELGFGALLAIGALPALRVAWQRETAAWLGLALIVASLILYTPDTRFPGLSAVPPCLGTLLIIQAGMHGQTRVGRLLSIRPMLHVGLVSYSFYLWHWPALVLGHIALNRKLTLPEAGAAVIAAYILAVLSLKFVEAPLRRSATPASRRSHLKVILASAAGLACFAGAGLGVWRTDGLAAYASPQVLAAQDAMRSINTYRPTCHVEETASAPGPRTKCTAGKTQGGYDILLWGDSHADHLMPGLADYAHAHGLSVRQATVSGCPPTMVVATSVPPERQGCLNLQRKALQEAAKQPGLQAIVVAARWSTEARNVSPPAREGKTEAEWQQSRPAHFSARIDALIREVRKDVGNGPRIVLVGSTPEFDFWPATCFARAGKAGSDPAPCETAQAMDQGWSPAADAILAAAVHKSGVAAVLPRTMLCDANGLCRTRLGNDILLRDDDHLTNAGSALVAQKIGMALHVTPAR